MIQVSKGLKRLHLLHLPFAIRHHSCCRQGYTTLLSFSTSSNFLLSSAAVPFPSYRLCFLFVSAIHRLCRSTCRTTPAASCAASQGSQLPRRQLHQMLEKGGITDRLRWRPQLQWLRERCLVTLTTVVPMALQSFQGNVRISYSYI